jgi:UDP-3-O-[3-hydroxymyristoyl] glucosamine N-acyltransferase
MVTQSLASGGHYGSGLPVQPAREWRRTVARVHRLGQFVERLAAIEARLGLRSGAKGEDDGGEQDA